MPGRGDLVTLETTDPNLGGVTDSRDREWPRAGRDDGRIAVPRREAELILQGRAPEIRRYRPTYGFHDADIWGPDGRLRRPSGEAVRP